MVTPIGLIYGIPIFAFQNKLERKFFSSKGIFVCHLLPSARHRTARRPHGPVRPVCGVAVMKRSVVVATPHTGHESFFPNGYNRVL